MTLLSALREYFSGDGRSNETVRGPAIFKTSGREIDLSLGFSSALGSKSSLSYSCRVFDESNLIVTLSENIKLILVHHWI